MESKEKLIVLRTLIVLSFVVMLALNTLANVLPIGGVTSGEVSDSYPNLFAPAGFTFSIWFVIYVLLFIFALYSTGLFKGADTRLLKKTGGWFIASSVFNAAWILAWHSHVIWLSMVLIAAIFVSLAVIYTRLSKEELALKERLLFKLPFSVYFGWLTIATVANVATLLKSVGWNGFGIAEPVWMIAVASVAAIIGIVTVIKNKDTVYGLVFIWAYADILSKHLAPWGFSGEYPGVIIAVGAALALLAAASVTSAVLAVRRKSFPA